MNTERRFDYLLQALIGVRALAGLEKASRWRAIIPQLDDAIERAIAVTDYQRRERHDAKMEQMRHKTTPPQELP